MGRGGSKKCKPIPAPTRGADLKSHPIPAPPPLRGGENPHGAKRGGAGQAGRGKIAIPMIRTLIFLSITVPYPNCGNNPKAVSTVSHQYIIIIRIIQFFLQEINNQLRIKFNHHHCKLESNT